MRDVPREKGCVVGSALEKAAHLLAQVDLSGAVARTALPAVRMPDAASLELIGMIGRWPGGCNGGMARARLQAACGDAMSGAVATAASEAIADPVRRAPAPDEEIGQTAYGAPLLSRPS